MISSIRGEVLAVGLDHAVIEVGGVGFTVQATPTTLGTLRRGTEARLYTTLMVREDSLTLFGFADVESRELFGLLQTVSGIGPRLAMAALAVLEPEKLRRALADGDITTLTQVPGIGRKGAERLIIELRDKVSAPMGGEPAPDEGTTVGSAVRADVVAALVGLGFSAKQAEQAVDKVSGEVTNDTSQVLRAALATLGKKK
ncbi:Holliday junction branch migration protein RuvA [Saccharomonospora viridis]|uniref:Holliday junction branch migration complex subunit RuvA n=1 Tax=Saccharomonospora viridis TaxID=1852 RepID=A0A837D654_9PSEU|nr:Holliday junction branch migration protein RuvA [Saccharomonospora viridis]KHF42685.1 holliday junction DNA helicase RuvA [Saccharomonospora viridis]SFO93936.1 Holliday junction DNA helicase subunit RuvA [Saccharomonospora viridis]